MSTIIPQEEHGVLDVLLRIRNQLTVLKKVGQKYRSSDVVKLYNDFENEVQTLFKIRKKMGKSEFYNNRVDDVIEDVYQILSLFWMALGKTNENPATYIQLISIHQYLEHLQDFGVYTMEDLFPLKDKVKELSKILQFNLSKLEDDTKISCLDLLATRKVNECEHTIRSLIKSFNEMGEELQPIQIKLIEYQKEISTIFLIQNKNLQKIKDIKKELIKIDLLKQEESYPFFTIDEENENQKIPSKGTSQVVGLLKRCSDDINEILNSETERNLVGKIKLVYERLKKIKQELLNLYETRRWTMREIDLWTYQVQLTEIDSILRSKKIFDNNINNEIPNVSTPLSTNNSNPNSPVASDINDNFSFNKIDHLMTTISYNENSTIQTTSNAPLDLDEKIHDLQIDSALNNNNEDNEGSNNSVLAPIHFLLQKCYRLIYTLLSSSEPIGEPLLPINNQLLTLKKCLTEVRNLGGPFTARELYPYQIKLASIDNLRIDGKFLDEHGLIPEGQGIVMALLNECYDIIYELKELVSE